MFYYNIYINNGVETFGTEDKTITVNEVVQTVDIKALAREINHENMLIPVQMAESVLQDSFLSRLFFLVFILRFS